MRESNFYPKLLLSVEELLKNFSSIPEKRKIELEKIAEILKQTLLDTNKVEMIFICTHNSRRSHLAQIWTTLASKYFGINNFYTYSGGTESTEFNHRCVKALTSVGFHINATTIGINPTYICKYNETEESITVFSKIYNDSSNPKDNFIAIMVCTDADDECPFVIGAKHRISLPYDDPKLYDNTELEESKYSERNKQIGTEMLYMISSLKNLLS
ncbi:protein-tyrosine-phosphatase [Candidatus Kapaibacterium sp.]